MVGVVMLVNGKWKKTSFLIHLMEILEKSVYKTQGQIDQDLSCHKPFPLSMPEGNITRHK